MFDYRYFKLRRYIIEILKNYLTLTLTLDHSRKRILSTITSILNHEYTDSMPQIII